MQPVHNQRVSSFQEFQGVQQPETLSYIFVHALEIVVL